MRNFSDPLNRCVILLVNVLILAYSSAASELIQGNFGAARPGAIPARPAKVRKESRRSSKSYPYHGVLDSVDASGKFFLLKGKTKKRQILVGPKTRVWKEEKRGNVREALPGDYVSGSVHKNSEGKEEASTIHIGKKTAPHREPRAPKE